MKLKDKNLAQVRINRELVRSVKIFSTKRGIGMVEGFDLVVAAGLKTLK